MKRVLLFIVIAIGFVIIYNFFTSIYSLWHKKDVLIHAQNQLNVVQKQNRDLKRQLLQVKNPQFVEEQARDKLFLVKPGENTVLIPKNLLPTPIRMKTPIPSKPNWQKWLEIFGLN